MELKIVTAASSNHFKSVINLIDSLNGFDIIFYDIGLSHEEANEIKLKKVEYRKFNYKNYPDFLNVHVNAGEYAWKPAVIREVSKEFKGLLVWSDAGNIFYGLNNLMHIINSNKIYTATSSGLIKERTDFRTVEKISEKYKDTFITKQSRNAACIGFNTTIDFVNEFIDEWFNFAMDKDCIAPENYDKSYHRHDQSILSILYYNYVMKYNLNIIDFYIDYVIHQDVD